MADAASSYEMFFSFAYLIVLSASAQSSGLKIVVSLTVFTNRSHSKVTSPGFFLALITSDSILPASGFFYRMVMV